MLTYLRDPVTSHEKGRPPCCVEGIENCRRSFKKKKKCVCHRESVNALRITGSGLGSVVMSKQGADNTEEMDLLLPQIGVFGMK